MTKFISTVAAALICAAATSSSATTLDFDSRRAVISGNVLSEFSQDGFVFSISQTGFGSIGANLFSTLYCVNQTGESANCNGNDDGDLVLRVQRENGVGDSFDVRFAGSGGVDSIRIVPTPLPAGFALLPGVWPHLRSGTVAGPSDRIGSSALSSPEQQHLWSTRRVSVIVTKAKPVPSVFATTYG